MYPFLTLTATKHEILKYMTPFSLLVKKQKIPVSGGFIEGCLWQVQLKSDTKKKVITTEVDTFF